MFNLHRIGLIARREITTRLKTRVYRWTLVTQVVVALIAGFAPLLMSTFIDDSTLGGGTVLVVNGDTAFSQRLQGYLQDDIPGLPAMTVIVFEGDSEAARVLVEDGEAAATVVLNQQDTRTSYEVITSDSDLLSLTSQRVQGALISSSIETNAIQAGMTDEQAARLVHTPKVAIENTAGESKDILDTVGGPEFIIVNVGLILIYVLLLMYGTWIAQGVVEEKSSRMMEIMVNAAPPRDLLLGKVIGVLVAALIQTTPMLLAAGLALSLQRRVAEMLDITLAASLDLDWAAISFQAIGMFLLYFVLSYLLYAAFYAASGALISRQEEVNQAVAPVMIVVVIGLFVGYIVMAIPNSAFAKITFLIPLTAPYAALPRVLLGDPSTGEVLLGIALLAISGVLAMMFAARVYRTGVLMYGQKWTPLAIFRAARTGKVAS